MIVPWIINSLITLTNFHWCLHSDFWTICLSYHTLWPHSIRTISPPPTPNFYPSAPPPNLCYHPFPPFYPPSGPAFFWNLLKRLICLKSLILPRLTEGYGATPALSPFSPFIPPPPTTTTFSTCPLEHCPLTQHLNLAINFHFLYHCWFHLLSTFANLEMLNI